MPTNQCDAFRGQSRSPNIVPFRMLGIVSCRAIVTLSLKRAVFPIFDFKNAVTLKTGLGVRQGHWKCHHAIERIRLPTDVRFYITMDQQIDIRRCITQTYSNHKVHLSVKHRVQSTLHVHHHRYFINEFSKSSIVRHVTKTTKSKITSIHASMSTN